MPNLWSNHGKSYNLYVHYNVILLCSTALLKFKGAAQSCSITGLWFRSALNFHSKYPAAFLIISLSLSSKQGADAVSGCRYKGLDNIITRHLDWSAGYRGSIDYQHPNSHIISWEYRGVWWFCFVYVCGWKAWTQVYWVLSYALFESLKSVKKFCHWMVLMIFFLFCCLLLILKMNTVAGWIDNSLHNNGSSEVLKRFFSNNFKSKSFIRFILSFINLAYWENKVKNVCMMIKICIRRSHSNTTVKPVIINNFQTIILFMLQIEWLHDTKFSGYFNVLSKNCLVKMIDKIFSKLLLTRLTPFQIKIFHSSH